MCGFQTSVDIPAIYTILQVIHLRVQLRLHMGITMVIINPHKLGQHLYCEIESVLNEDVQEFNHQPSQKRWKVHVNKKKTKHV